MNLKLLLLILLLPVFSFAQSVVITSRKVTYNRPKPLSEYKKSFTVTYPKVKAATPALSRKIEAAISYAKISNLNVKEEIREIQWLEEATYEVGYNKNGILTVILSVSGSGAYPSLFQDTVVVNLTTGMRVLPSDVFTDLPALAAVVKKAQDSEIARAKAEIAADSESNEIDSSDLFREANFKAKDLSEFAVDDNGVTFIYDYGLPHAILALQPEGKYKFTWAEIKPFIRRGGLLARFVE